MPPPRRCPACCNRCSDTTPIIPGLVMSPAGVFAICVMIVVARLLGWGADARWLVAAGLLVVAAANYWMSIMNLEISPWQVVWPRVVHDHGTVADFRAAERGGLQIHAALAARRGSGAVQPAAQRRGQRRHVDGANAARAARAVSSAAAGRTSRSIRSQHPGLFPG